MFYERNFGTADERRLEKIEESEKKLKELARKSGMPMTRKEYEERKKKRLAR